LLHEHEVIISFTEQKKLTLYKHEKGLLNKAIFLKMPPNICMKICELSTALARTRSVAVTSLLAVKRK
jgi:hypothetical protein